MRGVCEEGVRGGREGEKGGSRVKYRAVRYGAVWCGMVRYGAVRCGTVWYTQCGTVWVHSTVQYMVRYGGGVYGYGGGEG